MGWRCMGRATVQACKALGSHATCQPPNTPRTAPSARQTSPSSCCASTRDGGRVLDGKKGRAGCARCRTPPAHPARPPTHPPPRPSARLPRHPPAHSACYPPTHPAARPTTHPPARPAARPSARPPTPLHLTHRLELGPGVGEQPLVLGNVVIDLDEGGKGGSGDGVGRGWISGWEGVRAPPVVPSPLLPPPHFHHPTPPPLHTHHPTPHPPPRHSTTPHPPPHHSNPPPAPAPATPSRPGPAPSCTSAWC